MKNIINSSSLMVLLDHLLKEWNSAFQATDLSQKLMPVAPCPTYTSPLETPAPSIPTADSLWPFLAKTAACNMSMSTCINTYKRRMKKRMSSAKFFERLRWKTAHKGCHSACILGKVLGNSGIVLETTEIQTCTLNILQNFTSKEKGRTAYKSSTLCAS